MTDSPLTETIFGGEPRDEREALLFQKRDVKAASRAALEGLLQAAMDEEAGTPEAIMRDALRRIVNFEPDLSEHWTKLEAAVEEARDCAECARIRAIPFGIQTACNRHYSIFADLDKLREAERNYQRIYGPREIAREALKAADAPLSDEPTDEEYRARFGRSPDEIIADARVREAAEAAFVALQRLAADPKCPNEWGNKMLEISVGLHAALAAREAA